MSLPRAGSRFSDIATDIKATFGKLAGDTAYYITKELIEITPKLSNTLVNGWNYGPTATGHVLGKGASEFNNRGGKNGKTIIPEPYQPLRILPYKRYKNLHSMFVIWNNVPYLKWVNDGRVFGRETRSASKHINFVQRGITAGQAKAMAVL